MFFTSCGSAYPAVLSVTFDRGVVSFFKEIGFAGFAGQTKKRRIVEETIRRFLIRNNVNHVPQAEDKVFLLKQP